MNRWPSHSLPSCARILPAAALARQVRGQLASVREGQAFEPERTDQTVRERRQIARPCLDE